MRYINHDKFQSALQWIFYWVSQFFIILFFKTFSLYSTSFYLRSGCDAQIKYIISNSNKPIIIDLSFFAFSQEYKLKCMFAKFFSIMNNCRTKSCETFHKCKCLIFYANEVALFLIYPFNLFITECPLIHVM